MAEGSRIREKVTDDQTVAEIYSNRLVSMSSDGAVIMVTLYVGYLGWRFYLDEVVRGG